MQRCGLSLYKNDTVPMDDNVQARLEAFPPSIIARLPTILNGPISFVSRSPRTYVFENRDPIRGSNDAMVLFEIREIIWGNSGNVHEQ